MSSYPKALHRIQAIVDVRKKMQDDKTAVKYVRSGPLAEAVKYVELKLDWHCMLKKRHRSLRVNCSRQHRHPLLVLVA